MKTQEELNALREEVKTLNKKLAELTEEELAQVTGSGIFAIKTNAAVKTFQESVGITADSCQDVILAPGQFSAYLDGYYEKYMTGSNETGSNE